VFYSQLSGKLRLLREYVHDPATVAEENRRDF
jgi:hypothetical protein